MSRIDNQTPAQSLPPRTSEQTSQSSQAGDSSAFAARMKQQTEQKQQDAAQNSAHAAQTANAESSANSMLMQRHGMVLGRREGTVADLQAKLEAQSAADGAKGKGEAAGDPLLGDGGGLADGLSLKPSDAKGMGGSGQMSQKDQDSLLKTELDPANLNLDAAQAGKSQFQSLGTNLETSATVQVQGRRIPTEMLDKIVDQARVGVNAAGSPEFQFDLKGDVLGGMKMRMSMEEGQLKAIFVAENPEIRKFIDGNLQDLRRHLEDRGIHIRDLEVRDPEEDRRQRQREQNNKDREQAWG